MYTKDTQNEVKRVTVHVHCPKGHSAYKSGTTHRSFVVFDANVEDVYNLLKKTIDESARKR